MIATLKPIEIQKVAESRIHQVDWENLGFGHVFSDHMLAMEYHNGEWGAPVIQPYGPLHFSPAISSLHYGQAIFEGMKAFRNSDNEVFIFRPEENAKRMNHSAERLCMPTLPEDVFVHCVEQLISLDRDWVPTLDGEALYIRPHMFAIDEYVGVKPSDSYMFVVFTSPVGSYYTSELKVKIEHHYSRASHGGTGSAKAAGNYAAALLPTKKAQAEGYHQLLWTDAESHEYLEESGTMNVMFRKGNTIMTPQLSDSILSGITRDSILQVARDWGYEVVEKRIAVAELIEGLRNGEINEAFGAGTAATIAPIRTICLDGEDYNLNEYSTWEFAPKVALYLDRVKRGREKDTHNWNHVV